MVSLNKLFETTHHMIEKGEVALEHRPYLGMSQLGHECARYLWYSFRWTYRDTTSPRMIRLWNRGHREEPEIIKELEKIGIKCWGDQAAISNVFGHVQGHCDGMALGVIEAPKTTHLLEFKTVKAAGFKDLCKKKLKKYSSTYYGQCQLYMHHLKLTRTLFIAVNKDDDNYYIERIHYDKGEAEDLIRKGQSIVLSEFPPNRAFPTKTFFKCKWCAAKHQCWDRAPYEVNCRTCKYIELEHEGKWSCSLDTDNVELPVKKQRIGCSHYESL